MVLLGDKNNRGLLNILKKKNKIRLKKLLLQVVALLVINFIAILLFLQLSSVQTYLGRQLAIDIKNKTGFEINIGKVDIVWLDKVNIEDIEIKDLSSNEMISVKTLMVNYQIVSLRNKHRIILDNIVLDQAYAHFNLDDSVVLNITSFIAKIKKAYLPKTSKKPKPFIIKNIEIINGNFTYNHLGREKVQGMFDYNHFGFDSIYANASNLIIVSDTVQLVINKLQSIEISTQLPIKSMRVNYHLSKSQMKLNGLETEIGNSVIKDSITLNYNTTADLSHFVDKVLINAHFKKLKLSTQDLKYFSSYFDKIYDTILFTGNVNGRINDFRSNNFNIHFGANSNIKGNAYFEGLPDIYNTFIDLKFKQSSVHKSDLSIYISSKEFKKYYPIDSARVTVNGSFTGYPKDFVAKASFNTSLGFAQTDLNLKLDNNPAKSSYSGAIKLVNFDLGKVANSSSIIGKTTLVGKIKGIGLTTTSANFNLESSIQKVDFYNYEYQNIETNAHFAHELFDGSLTINDPNLILNTSGVIDLRNNINIIELNGELVKAQLDKLHIRNDSFDISAKFNINIKGIVLDSIVGKIDISNLIAHNNNSTYEVDQIEVISEIKDKNRILVLYSDRVDLKIEGEYNFTTAFKDFKSIWLENKVNFLNQKKDIKAFYQGTEIPKSNSNLSFDINLYNINPLINLFDPLVYLSANTKLHGSLKSDITKELVINFSNDTIIYNHNLLINNNLHLATKSNYLSRDLIVDFNFESKHQKLRSKSILDSLLISALWQNDSLNFNLKIQQGKEKNINDINGLMLFKKDTTLLSIKESQIKLLKQSWNFNKNNQVTFIKDKILLSNISITSGSQELFASGTLSKTFDTPIIIKAINIKMNNLNPLLKNELKGVLNGSVEISNLFNIPLIESNIRIDSFSVDGFNFGNIEENSNWNQENNLFDINFFLERNQKKLVNITGYYAPLGGTKALNLNAKLLETDLKLIAPFTKGLFSNIDGQISGNISITGALFEPKLRGSGKITHAKITVDYLQSSFNTQGNWRMDSTSFAISDLKISDNNIGSGMLDALFTHSNFKDFNMDLKANFNNLIILNTIAKDNDYFYGTAIGSGNLSITGPFSNLIITTRAKTEKGTKFYIPLTNDKSNIKQEDFISFTSFTKEVDEVKTTITEEVKLKNITVNLDIEITPDAYAEIIFDLTAGDIIRGRGNGNLSLGIDTKGEFTVLGEYEFTEGAYNFTMYNIVNKEFKINPKSKIIWSGDPYLGKMNIDAIYEVNTSLEPIIDPAYKDLPEVSRIYPSKVKLELEGPLLSPDIAFDIIIEDYPKSNVNIDTEVRAFLNKIHNDEQEMNRQVFSLLVFRKYSPPNSFSTGGTLGSSVSEFVSNQLSYWVSQMDENLTIDFDLNDLDENALKTFQLRVSYAFMDGKLIVTRDGGFTDQNQEATLASITGDWTVEYLLTEDGKVRAKIFKKTNYDQLSSSSGDSDELVNGGFSLLYTTSFDSIKELFKRNKGEEPSPENNNKTPNEAIKPDDDLNTP